MGNKLKLENLDFEKQCIIDIGKVFYFENKVYRLINNPILQRTYRDLLQSKIIENLENLGLVKTKMSSIVIEEYPDSLILEHEKLYYFLHPSEYTNEIFFNAALHFLKLTKELAKNGYVLIDAHPYNISFQDGKFKFFDFTSIRSGNTIHRSWLNEFYLYFAVPIYLASRQNTLKLSKLYRKEHKKGIGLSMASSIYIKKFFFKKFWTAKKYLNKPHKLLDFLEKWIQAHQPKNVQGQWDNYEQEHEDSYLNPVTIKQKFVKKILSEQKKSSLIDLACNKGYFSYMAEDLGYRVIALDYEEKPLDIAFKQSHEKSITFANLDFTYPTPAYGWGNVGLNSFERFRSDIALALGLIHHVCLIQSFPVKLFCDTCIKYSQEGVILEFVYPEDIHVQKWNASIPEDYNIDAISAYFSGVYPNKEESYLMDTNGIKRKFIYYYK